MQLPNIAVGRPKSDFFRPNATDPETLQHIVEIVQNARDPGSVLEQIMTLREGLSLPDMTLDPIDAFVASGLVAPPLSTGEPTPQTVTLQTPASLPTLTLNTATAAVSVDMPNETVSVLWNQAILEAVIIESTGPTIASRAYSVMHTAMFEAWAAYDPDAVGTAFGDLLQVAAPTLITDENKAEAMSYAAYVAAVDLFPGQQEIFDKLMDDLGYPLPTAGATLSDAAELGVMAGEGVVAMRANDGSNQQNGYIDTTGYAPVNSGPDDVVDITKWTPTLVPIDSDDPTTLQTFLTPQWGGVTSFAIEDLDGILPPAPQPFFVDGIDATLDIDAGTITLNGLTEGFSRQEFRDLRTDLFDQFRGTEDFKAVKDFIKDARKQLNTGEAPEVSVTIDVTRDLVGPIINPGFIEQAEEVVSFSTNLTQEQQVIAEFWEDGPFTAFPPGTWMVFAEWVSTRDNHTLDQDAELFFAMSNAVMDAGIATWEAKVVYDYARPVNAIRDLGQLGLIGDENGMIEAFTFDGFGGGSVQMIPATEFVTYQNPRGDPSPPFGEYTSGHSSFSAAGAEVLRLFTGSDEFGASISTDEFLFLKTPPADTITLSWDTFKDAADEAGISRLYGGIHFFEGDIFGRELGQTIGEDVFNEAQNYIEGTTTDFFFDTLI